MRNIFAILAVFTFLSVGLTASPLEMMIDVEAGDPQTICYGETLNLDILGASISGDVTDGMWFTMGDGIFLPGNGSSGVFSTTDQYQPGPGDLGNGSFTLILVSDDPDGNGPMVEVSDVVTISFMNAPALVCNNSINVSLADGCQQEVDIFMLLANPMQPYDKYIITLYDENDAIIPDNILTVEHLGMNVTFSVGHDCTSNTCSGEITVTDNIPPFLNCVDAIAECEFGVSPEVVGFPIPFYANATAVDDNTYSVTDFDACGLVTLTYHDLEVEMACASTGYIKEITRSWTAEDEAGNTSSCNQIILLEPLPLSAVMSPPDYDGSEEQPLSCDGDWEALPNGYPSPEATGMPSFPDCGNIDATYSDVEFEECGSGFKVVRQWFVIDWCTTESFNENQIIKILDQEGPVFECPEDLTLSSQGYSCVSVLHDLIFVDSVYDCSQFDTSFSILTLDSVDISALYINSSNTIDGLPVGEYLLVYIATDVCGNASQCTTSLEVIDDSSPFAVCDGYTQVALSSNGIAELFATSVDDGSFDNCGNITMEIAKMTDECNWGLGFGPKVHFCCEEVGDTIMVAFRVTDDQGLTNTCMVSVFVEDKLPPIIECPDDLTISCTFDFDIEDLSVFGNVVDGEQNVNPIIIEGEEVGSDGFFSDNCEASVEENSSYDIECGAGIITRTFTATDLYGQTANCTQTITIINDNPFLESDITWPANFEMNGCVTIQADPSVTGEPTWENNKCALVTATYEDQVCFISGGACVKVLREWTVIDWCQYIPGENQAIWTYLQEIKLKNNIAPVILDCEDKEVCSYDEDCTSEVVTFTALANDDCTDSLQLLYLWELDIDDDGSIDDTGQGIEFSEELLYGTHRVYWKVEDGCGNSTTCDYSVTIRDCKNPTPYCNSSITTTVMPSAGMIEIWAIDYDFGSFDNCTAPEDLIFSFSQDVNDDSRVITCDDIENGVAQEFIFELWVTDEYGNQERCDVRLIVQDNADACPNGTIKGKVSGKVMSQHDKFIQDVEMTYTASIDTFSGMEMTDESGVFELESTPQYLKYVLRPKFESNPNSGVSTLDLVMIQQHILEIRPFDNPYDIIASDLTGNEKVSSSDLLTMRKMILGIIDEWPGNLENWVFVDSTFEFPDETHPFYYPDSIVISALKDTIESANFIAVKMGDVNGSYSSFGGKNEDISTRNNEKIVASAVYHDERQSVDFIFEDLDDLVDGLQLSVNIPEGAELESQFLNEGDYVIQNNVLKISWVNSLLEDIESVPFFTLSGISGNEIEISQNLTPEIYIDLNPYTITLETLSTTTGHVLSGENNLIAILQNPFVDAPVVKNLSTERVNLEFLDSQGRLLFREILAEKAQNILDRAVHLESGIYFIRASHGRRTQSAKLVKIR